MSEVEALQSSLQSMESSMKTEHAKEISSLTLDLQSEHCFCSDEITEQRR